MLRQIVRAGRLNRSFYESLLYDNYATGNAVVVIAVVGAIPALRFFDVADVAFNMLWAVARSGIMALAVWASGVHLFRRYGHLPVTFRLVGFAHTAFIPMTVAPWLVGLSIPLTIVSAFWFFFALRIVAGVQFDLNHPEDSFAAAAGVLGWYIGTILF